MTTKHKQYTHYQAAYKGLNITIYAELGARTGGSSLRYAPLGIYTGLPVCQTLPLGSTQAPYYHHEAILMAIQPRHSHIPHKQDLSGQHHTNKWYQTARFRVSSKRQSNYRLVSS